jgi:hypothetical protein
LISLLEIFDQNTPTELTPAKRFPISPEIKSKGFFPFMVYPAINPKANRISNFLGIEVPAYGPEMLVKDI